MPRLLSVFACLLFALPALADDWTGKTIKVKEEGLKLGRKLGNGLVRDGAALDKTKTYAVKADDGTYLELAGGFVFKSEAEVVADAKPLPDKKEKAADPAKKADVWAPGTKILPKKPTDQIQFGDVKDGKEVFFKLAGFMPMEVRDDRGDGWVRVYDWIREGWARKDDFVSKEDAPIYWDKALKANPVDTFALYMRGLGWLEKGEYDNAIADFNECIRLNPSDAAAYNGRGNARKGKKELEKAIADYTEAIRLDPKISETPYYNRGNVHRSLGEYDKAVEDFTESIRQVPDSSQSYQMRGLAWEGKKEFDIALKDFDDAVRLDPKDPNAFRYRGNARLRQKEYDKAIADYDAVLKLDPANVAATTERGSALSGKKDYAGAMAAHEAALKLAPKSELVLNRLAWLLACCPDEKYRDGKKAVEHGKRLVELNSKWWGYQGTLAAAHAEAGDFEAAVTSQQKAIELLKAEKNPDADKVKVAETRLELYRAKKPYRKLGWNCTGRRSRTGMNRSDAFMASGVGLLSLATVAHT